MRGGAGGRGGGNSIVPICGVEALSKILSLTHFKVVEASAAADVAVLPGAAAVVVVDVEVVLEPREQRVERR